MPIYEFYCSRCHMIFNFFSSTINTSRRPSCPKCGKTKLDKQMSVFSTLRRNEEEGDSPLPDLDEAKMEQAMNVLAQESQNVDEEDPRQAANLMRKLTDMTGMNLGPAMEEALQRMEAGEDPDQIEAEMGDLLEEEEPFAFKEKGARNLRKFRPPKVDDTLYDL